MPEKYKKIVDLFADLMFDPNTPPSLVELLDIYLLEMAGVSGVVYTCGLDQKPNVKRHLHKLFKALDEKGVEGKTHISLAITTSLEDSHV
jgi:hypothetical protein